MEVKAVQITVLDMQTFLEGRAAVEPEMFSGLIKP